MEKPVRSVRQSSNRWRKLVSAVLVLGGLQQGAAAQTEDWALKIGGRSLWFSTTESAPGKMPILFSSPRDADVSRGGDGKVVLTCSYSHPEHPDWAWTRKLSFVPAKGDSMECEFFETRANRPGADVRARGVATRIAPLPPAPDVKSLEFGEGIDLFRDGLDGWEVSGTGRKSFWSFRDGVLENNGSGGANIRTKRCDFTDFRLSYDVRADKGCNSGVYLRGIYEIQTIDSYGKEPDCHNMGAVYGRATPSVTADRPAGEWQHVEAILCDRHATVVLNGVKIIDNVPLRGITGGALSPDQFAPGPIMIQGDHKGGAYRNMVLEPVVNRRSRESLSVRTAGEFDIAVYGATSAGIAAAVQARRMGLEPVVIEPSPRIGGLTTGGLGQTDSGIKDAFGGIAREFYKDIKAHYEKDSSWIFQKRSEYKPRGKTCWESGEDSMWTFEPGAARKVLDSWVRENRITVFRNERLDRTQGGVEKSGGRIVSIRTESGRRFRAKIFLDCTYEGDLMAAAGVSYTIGREPNSKYGETINGIQRALMKNHQLNDGVDPYVRKGDPSSGLLPGIEPDVDAPDGSGDGRVQAYCYRMCLTDDPRNRIPFEKPQGYRELDYELLLRNLEAGPLCPKHDGMPWINSPMPNRKTDTNNRTGFSTDFIGGADRWPEASYAEREEIALRHLKYQKGLMWTLANNPRVPERIRREVARWGMCKDEFAGERGGGWQYQLYVREARRMVGEYVMTEHECRGGRRAPRPVALAAYGMDSHNCRRYVTKKGFVLNEGNIEDYSKNPPGMPFERFRPYPVDYGAIVPKRGECSNLLVPVCVSASHIAFGSIRMEPVFFALGQSAATAAAQAIADGCAVQDVDYSKLRGRLLKDGQRLGMK